MSYITSIPYCILCSDSAFIPVYLCAYFTLENLVIFLHERWKIIMNHEEGSDSSPAFSSSSLSNETKTGESSRKNGIILGVMCMVLLYCLCYIKLTPLAWFLVLPTLVVYIVHYVIELGYNFESIAPLLTSLWRRTCFTFMKRQQKREIVLDELPFWLYRVFSPNLYGLGRSTTDGNCLFDSIRLALLRGKPQLFLTNDNLREMVASSVLNTSNETTSSTLKLWKQLLMDRISEGNMKEAIEFKHAYPLLYDQYPYTSKTRKKVYKIMMSPSHYWGDEHAIRCLESHLPIQCFVFVPNGDGISYSVSYPLHSERQAYLKNPASHRVKIYLVLHHEHYQPILMKPVIKMKS